MLSTIASQVKKGWTHDPECGRTTHRIRVARQLLAEVGIEPTIQHRAESKDGMFRRGACRKNPDSPSFGRSHFSLGFDIEGCDYNCITVWPSWVTDDMFESAARAADAIQTLRGTVGQAQINLARASRG